MNEPTQQLTVQPSGLALAAISIEELIGQVQLIQQAMKAVMREGEHYGVIPGTGRKNPETGKEEGKPTLLKPGAEKLCFLFRLAPSYETIETDLPGGHKSFQVRCRLHHITSGALVSEGVGICTTLEGKYRYRKEVLKDENDQPVLVPGNYWKDRNPEKIGGRQFSVTKQDGKWYVAHKVEHDNPADYHNTVVKMACKRALVAATLNATAASDIFTQDLEDTPEEIREEAPRQERQETRKEPPPARRKPEPVKATEPKQTEPEPPAQEQQQPNGGVANGNSSTLQGVVTQCRPSEFDGKKYYWAEIKGRAVFTPEQKLGEDLFAAEGQEIEALVRPAKKANRWILVDFHFPKE
jgi:hypothetical protein